MSTPAAIGHVEAIFRYPVKSMRGERVEAAGMGWHGLILRAAPQITAADRQSVQ